MSDLKKYKSRKTGAEVSAVQVGPNNVDRLVELTGGIKVVETNPFNDNDTFEALNVEGIAGWFRASQGDFVLQLETGEFTKVSDHLFHHVFEEV